MSARERAKRPGSVPYFGAAGQVGWIDKPLFNEPLVLLGEDGVQFFDSAKSKAYSISGPAWVNNHAHVLRALPTIDRRYLLHFLNQFDYRGFANGTTRLKLTQSAMRQMPICYPELDEQRRIVDILEDHLSRLDAASNSMSTSIARLRLLQESWLSTHLGTPPSEELTTVADCLLESRGGWSRSQKHLVADIEGVPYLKMNNISRSGELVLHEVVHVRADANDLRRYAIQAGDVLFNSKNSGDLIGKTSVATDAVSGWTFNENIMRLRFDNRVQPQFAGLWFLAPIMRRQIRRAASASTNVAAVYKNQLVTMPMWVPSAATQSRLVDGYRSLADASIYIKRELVAARRRSETLRRSLLTAAFAGHLTGRTTDMEMVEEMTSV